MTTSARKVIQQQYLLVKIAVEPLGIGSLAVAGDAYRISIIDELGFATTGWTIEKIDLGRLVSAWGV